jgi:hypothetical protein
MSHSSEDSAPDGIRTELSQLIELERKRLQLQSATRPWFRQPTLWISAFAFLVSVGSTIITVENNRSQAQTTKHEQLVTLVEQLAQVPQVQAQIATTYRNDQPALLRLAGSESTAEEIQAEEAAQIIDSLHGDVAPSEAYQVGLAFADRGLQQQALRYYRIAISRPSNAQVKANIYRVQAAAWYALGNIPKAFAGILQAYNAESAQEGFSSAEVDQNRIFTDLYDVPKAISVHACARASAELADAIKLTARINKASSSYSSDTARETADRQLVSACT